MLRNLAFVVGYAVIQMLSTTALVWAADFGTAEEAKAMLERAVAAVKEGKAKALDAETAALKKRWDEVDSQYLKTEGGAAVILTSRQAKAIERIAEALENKENKLTSVVFPQMESAKTVLPVGKN